MDRRDALIRLGTLAGAAAAGPTLLGGCSDDRRLDGQPKGITTIVTVMMENRSYDHYLGARALEGLGGDGLTRDMVNPNGNGEAVAVFHERVLCVPDPPHNWDSSHAQFNAGRNDGFLTEYEARYGAQTPPHAMGYLTREELPLSWAMADAWASCDAWFSSLMGPTWPNRGYLHSAQSGGLTSNMTQPGGWKWPTIYARLDEAGIDWAYYFSDLPTLGLFGNLDLTGHTRRVHFEFFDDALLGKLPPVVFVDPAFTANDDHPPHHPMLGQQFLASVYAALAASPQWENTLLVITYDEHGGFFDHVAPPRVADARASEGLDQLGFRVPTLVAGPYVKQGFVSSVVRDHSSVLAHIQKMFDLAPLTDRDAGAHDLSELLDLERLARGEPAAPVAMPAVEVDESMITEACQYARRAAPTDLEILADSGGIDPRYDARSDTRDLLYTIGDTLDALGAGRIRRGR